MKLSELNRSQPVHCPVHSWQIRCIPWTVIHMCATFNNVSWPFFIEIDLLQTWGKYVAPSLFMWYLSPARNNCLAQHTVQAYGTQYKNFRPAIDMSDNTNVIYPAQHTSKNRHPQITKSLAGIFYYDLRQHFVRYMCIADGKEHRKPLKSDRDFGICATPRFCPLCVYRGRKKWLENLT